MHTQKSKQKLKKEIQHSIFLEENVKKELLESFDKLDDHDYRVLASLFGRAEKKQDKLIDKIVTYDETFVGRVKQFKKDEIKKYQKETENKQRKTEQAEDILKGMEEW
ncbi:hypothetical protein IT413_03005 [Candidatus Peregrinibacteria bacterium]|nr:hypothetical protein [Candidatus Peregrinibacteria bacterium]